MEGINPKANQKPKGEMMRTLNIAVEISDEHAAALEKIKPFLIADPHGGLTERSSLEEVYMECSERGLSLLNKRMVRREKGAGTYVEPLLFGSLGERMS